MSAVSGNPRHIREVERTLMRAAVESFWTAVALTIGLLAFFLVAGGPSIVTWQVTAAALVLLLLWALHARAVRRHVDDVHRDERWRHARERRGF
jgi:Flp pilus assembly protein TadB